MNPGDLPAQPNAPSPFHPLIPELQTAWDNTSLTMLKECPRKYQLAITRGWSPKTTAAPLVFGSLLHKLLELYDKARVAGESHRDAQIACVYHALRETCEALWVFQSADGTTRPAEPDEPGAVKILSFWYGDSKRSRQTLVRSFIWYTEQFCISDPLETVVLASTGKAALELSFRFQLPLLTPGESSSSYIYCGHIDKVARFNGELYVQERKHTTATLGDFYFDRFAPDSQTSGYLAAASIILGEPVRGVIVDAVQVAVSFSRVHRHLLNKSPEVIDEWLGNVMHWIKQAEYYAITYKDNLWPMNEASCHKFSGCQFREFCSRAPSVRESVLAQTFRVKHWNPLEIRGDYE